MSPHPSAATVWRLRPMRGWPIADRPLIPTEFSGIEEDYMRNKLIAVAAVAAVPALAWANGSGPRTVAARDVIHGTVPDTVRDTTTQSDTSTMGRDTTAQSDTGAMQRDTGRTRMRDTTMMRDTSMMRMHDTTMHDTTMMRDTSMMRDTTRMHRDTARDDTTALQRGNLTYETSTGGLYSPSRGNAGLSTEQVKQLQQALNDAGCHAGPVDGLMGPQTRQGIACLREQRSITGDNLNDVLQALNLGFTASDTTAA